RLEAAFAPLTINDQSAPLSSRHTPPLSLRTMRPTCGGGPAGSVPKVNEPAGVTHAVPGTPSLNGGLAVPPYGPAGSCNASPMVLFGRIVVLLPLWKIAA